MPATLRLQQSADIGSRVDLSASCPVRKARPSEPNRQSPLDRVAAASARVLPLSRLRSEQRSRLTAAGRCTGHRGLWLLGSADPRKRASPARLVERHRRTATSLSAPTRRIARSSRQRTSSSSLPEAADPHARQLSPLRADPSALARSDRVAHPALAEHDVARLRREPRVQLARDTLDESAALGDRHELPVARTDLGMALAKADLDVDH